MCFFAGAPADSKWPTNWPGLCGSAPPSSVFPHLGCLCEQQRPDTRGIIAHFTFFLTWPNLPPPEPDPVLAGTWERQSLAVSSCFPRYLAADLRALHLHCHPYLGIPTRRSRATQSWTFCAAGPVLRLRIHLRPLSDDIASSTIWATSAIAAQFALRNTLDSGRLRTRQHHTLSFPGAARAVELVDCWRQRRTEWTQTTGSQSPCAAMEDAVCAPGLERWIHEG